MFSPARVEIPPSGSAWGWVGVSAPRPERGTEVTRQLQIGASDGREEVAARSDFIQTSADWIPIVRAILTLIGGVLVILGAFTPWMVMLPDYYATELPKVASSTDIVEQTQPGARAGIIILAIMMIAGILGKGGKLTMSSAMLIATAIIGYFVFVSTEVGTGGPMYGAILIGAGAVVGFVGGLLARYQNSSR